MVKYRLYQLFIEVLLIYLPGLLRMSSYAKHQSNYNVASGYKKDSWTVLRYISPSQQIEKLIYFDLSVVQTKTQTKQLTAVCGFAKRSSGE